MRWDEITLEPNKNKDLVNILNPSGELVGRCWKELVSPRSFGYNLVIDLVESESYKRDYKLQISKVTRKRILNLKRELLTGEFIFWDNDKLTPSSRSHEIERYSSEAKGFLAWSKDIDPNLDRLTYYVYKPKIVGSNLIIPISLRGCKGHHFGTSKNYSDISYYLETLKNWS